MRSVGTNSVGSGTSGGSNSSDSSGEWKRTVKKVLFQATFVVVAPIVWIGTGIALEYHMYWITPVVITLMPLICSIVRLGMVGASWNDDITEKERKQRDRADRGSPGRNVGDAFNDGLRDALLPTAGGLGGALVGARSKGGNSFTDSNNSTLPTTEDLPKLVTNLIALNHWLCYWALWPLITLIQSLLVTVKANKAEVKVAAEHNLNKSEPELTAHFASGEKVFGGRIQPWNVLFEQILLVVVVWASFFGGSYLSVAFGKGECLQINQIMM